MEALRINDFVGEKGITIDIDKISQFKNRRVEIIILPMEDESTSIKKKKFFSAIGQISIDTDEINLLRENSIL